ncbi:MAG: dual specificity protein phosphatase family protein [Candidatus Omnitrophica bacterium]|nr:dual specificity protein phosphatase family protein [Candidatus Omnitrophota bacterium]
MKCQAVLVLLLLLIAPGFARAELIQVPPASPAPPATQAREEIKSSVLELPEVPEGKASLLLADASKKIKNFGQLESGIYRGGEPDFRGLEALKQLGAKTVLNFRFEPKKVENERKMVESLGMDYVNLPWDGRGEPSRETVQRFIGIVKNPENQPIYFHCRRGAERTGLMWACYRVAVNGWPPERAYEEMRQYKFRSFWYPHLGKFLYNFSKDYGYKNDYTKSRFTRLKEWFLTHVIYSPFLYRTRSE